MDENVENFFSLTTELMKIDMMKKELKNEEIIVSYLTKQC